MANIDIVNNFFKYFATTPSAQQIANFVPLLFSPDKAASGKNPQTPSLGIAAGNQTNAKSLGPQNGPQFLGQQAIITCFTQIFVNSFQGPTFTPLPPANSANPIFCYSSSDGKTIDTNPVITVPAILHTGNHNASWFPYGHPAYSKPLSDIEPDGTQSSDVPACVVFTFDPTVSNNPLIINLAIFMDRCASRTNKTAEWRKWGRLRLDLASSTASNAPDIRITNRGSPMIFAMNWCISAAKYCRNALLGWAEFLGHADDRRLPDLCRSKLAGDAKRWSRPSD